MQTDCVPTSLESHSPKLSGTHQCLLLTGGGVGWGRGFGGVGSGFGVSGLGVTGEGAGTWGVGTAGEGRGWARGRVPRVSGRAGWE